MFSVGDLSCHCRMDAFYRNVVLLPPRAQGGPGMSCMKALFRCTSGCWALTMTLRSMFVFVENTFPITTEKLLFLLAEFGLSENVIFDNVPHFVSQELVFLKENESSISPHQSINQTHMVWLKGQYKAWRAALRGSARYMYLWRLALLRFCPLTRLHVRQPLVGHQLGF